MYCKHCGKEVPNTSKFCTSCGKKIEIPTETVKGEPQNQDTPIIKTKIKSESETKFKNVIGTIVGIGIFLAIVWYGSGDDTSISQNNKALESFDSGNTQEAILQIEEAELSAVSNANKINSLINAGYIYLSDEQSTQALTKFREAQNLSKNGSYEYYLVSGEIALLEKKPSVAIYNFEKAYEIDPNNYQAANSLGLLYLGIEDITESYTDYEKALLYLKKAHQYSDLDLSKENLGMAYFFNEDYDTSLSYFFDTDYENDGLMNFWIGLNYLLKEDDLNAKYYFRQAQALGYPLSAEYIQYINSN